LERRDGRLFAAINLSGIKGTMQLTAATLPFFLVAVTTACAEGQTASWNLRDHIPLEEVVVQSHRGAGVLSPENSVEAFGIAWKLGTIPEADLRTSRDGVIVAFHDGDFQRILPSASNDDRKRGVADLTWDELRRLDIGAWKGPKFAGQRIPRMTDVYVILERHPQRRLYIDIKNVDLEQLADESKSVHKQLILASTKYDVIRQWKKLAPESNTLHWMGGTEAELAARFAELRTTKLADITQLQIHVRTGKDGALTPSPAFLASVGEELRQHGILFQALPWDRKDPEICWQLMDLGVASFATDYPDVVMQAIRDYYQQDRRTKP
jgi:glycerophosphoryl diester phosphodiesterase